MAVSLVGGLVRDVVAQQPSAQNGHDGNAMDLRYTGFSSEIGTKLRDLAVGQAEGSCYSWAALSSNDSKTLYCGLGCSAILLGQYCPQMTQRRCILTDQTLCT